MRVCHVILHSCIRVHKLAAAQKEKGDVKPFLLNARFAEQHPYWQYSTVFRFFAPRNEVALAAFMRTAENVDNYIDAWHVHNTPDVFAEPIKAVSKKPIFWDVHDLQSHQKKDSAYKAYEDASAKAANHIFTISKGYQNLLSRRYPHRKVTAYGSMVPRAWYPQARATSPARQKTVVYQGGLSNRPGHYRHIWDWIAETGVQWEVFPGAEVEGGKYMVPGNCKVHPSATVFDLYKELTTFEAGFVGTALKLDPMFDGALPNKLYEYIACGLPIIACNAPAVKQFLEQYPDLGVNVESAKDVPEALKKIRKDKMREKVAKQRNKFSMDVQNKYHVEPVYREHLG